MAATTDILLATYNGGAYLGAQLDSLLAQTEGDFTLRVRDDGSSDDTAEVLRAYAPRFGDRFVLLPTDLPTGSAKSNFAKLMEASTADHLLFADHDDVWTPDHVAEIRRLLTEAEAAHGAATPIYAFTDVTPVDGALQPLAESFFAYKGIDPAISQRLSQSIVCPPMLGCASGINRALRDLALPLPAEEVTGHDWWALLLAAAAGHCTWSTARTVAYRLHGGNASGQVASDARVYAKMGGKAAKVRRGVMLRRRQADAVRARVADVAGPESLAVLEGFGRAVDRGAVARRLGLIRGGYLYPDLTRTLGMLALC